MYTTNIQKLANIFWSYKCNECIVDFTNEQALRNDLIRWPMLVNKNLTEVMCDNRCSMSTSAKAKFKMDEKKEAMKA